MKKLIALISLIAVAVYPVIFEYTRNIREVKFNETFLPAAIAITLAIIVFLVCLVALKDLYKASLAGSIFMLLYWNYGLIEQGVTTAIKAARYWHIMPVLLFIFIHLVVCIKRVKLPQKEMFKIVAVVCMIFLGLSIFNISSTIVTQRLTEDKVKQQSQTQKGQLSAQLNDKPNVYYIILDEYSAFDVIEKYYQYDNSVFKEFLLNNKFTISESSKNIVPYTAVVVPNLLNYSYIVKDVSMENYKYKENSALFNLFKKNGYTTFAIDTPNSLSPTVPKLNADVQTKLGEKEISSNEFLKMLLSGTALKIVDILTSNDEGYYRSYRNVFNNSFSSLESYSKKEGKGRFIFAHILSPHEPFVFDKYGKPIDDSSAAKNWEDKQYYLGQYIYITRSVKETIGKIIENDPDSIIILQSDHSIRTVKGIQEEDKVKILNSVYYRGEKFENIDHISGLNTLRMVLSKLFSMDLPLLED